MVSLLLEDSADGSLESPIPASTRLLACQVSAGAAWVDFSSAYGQLSGMELTIADYCVTLSLSQIVGIYSWCRTSPCGSTSRIGRLES